MSARILHKAAITSAVLLLALTGCVVRDASLYPTTDQGAAVGVGHGQLVGHGTGSGTINFAMPDGEALQGRYSIVAGSSVGFGSTFGTLYGPRGVASGSATTTSISMDGLGQGAADLVGNRGTVMQCEFANNNMFGHGFGACRTTKGVVWRLVY
jgi:hypothetical protein